MKNINLILLFSLCFLSSFSQNNNTVALHPDFQSLTIGKYLKFIDDSTDAFSMEMVYNSLTTNADLWYEKEEDIPNFGNQKVPRWVYFSLSNSSKQNMDLLLEINNSYINELRLYEFNPSGFPELIGQSGDKIPFENRLIKHRHNLFDIQLEAAQGKEYLMYVEKEGVLSLPLVVWDRNEYFSHTQSFTLIDGIYFGMLLLIILYTIVLTVGLRKPLYPIYGINVLMFAFSFLTIKGYGYQYIFSRIDWIERIDTPDFAVFGSIFFTLFSIQFLDLKKYARKYYKLLHIYIVVYLSIYLIFNSIPDFIDNNLSLVMRMYYPLLVGILFLAIVGGLVVFKKNRKAASFYLLSNFLLFCGLLISVLAENGILSINFFTSNSLLFGSLSEMFVISLGIAFQIKQINDDRFLLLEKTAQHKERLNNAMIAGEKEERKRISEELQMGVGEHLEMMKASLLSELGDDSDLVREMDNLNQEVGEISNALMPQSLMEKGFKESLLELFERFASSKAYKLSVEEIDMPEHIDGVDIHSIYRIVQEVLNNIIKHAKATEVSIQLSGFEDRIRIQITDNGIGYAPEKIQKGVGLNSMESRAKSMGAKLTTDSELGKGSSVLLEVEFKDTNLKK